jgi:hypothetical protein
VLLLNISLTTIQCGRLSVSRSAGFTITPVSSADNSGEAARTQQRHQKSVQPIHTYTYNCINHDGYQRTIVTQASRNGLPVTSFVRAPALRPLRAWPGDRPARQATTGSRAVTAKSLCLSTQSDVSSVYEV